jgi:hypothetical protein
VQWSDLTSIRIKQLSNPEIKVIMPLYANPQALTGDLPVIDSVPTTFIASGFNVANQPTAYQALAANPSRQTFAVTNLGSGNVYLDLDAPTDPNKRMFTIAAGGTYVSDFPYVGAVFLWSANNTARSCEVRELIQ